MKGSWRLVGKGSFGSVFSFQDGSTGVKYSVKVVKTYPTKNKEKHIRHVSSEP